MQKFISFFANRKYICKWKVDILENTSFENTPNFSFFIKKTLTAQAFQSTSVTETPWDWGWDSAVGEAVQLNRKIRNPTPVGLQLKCALENGAGPKESWVPTGGIFTDTNKKEIGAAGTVAQMSHLLPLLHFSFPFQEKLLWHENYHLYF